MTKATLTNLHPYVGWRPSARTHLWGVLGMGTGTLEYEEETADAIARYETGLDSRMAAAGVKVQLNEPDAGIGLAGKMDVLVTRTRSERRQNLMPASAGTRRVRLLVEAQGRGFGITPTVEVGSPPRRRRRRTRTRDRGRGRCALRAPGPRAPD